MEHVVFNDLRYRGWSVEIGVVPVIMTGEDCARRQQRLEIDSVALRGSDQAYVQSTFTLPTPRKVEQEYRSWRKVSDAFRKDVIVSDDGIVTMGFINFLLDPGELERRAIGREEQRSSGTWAHPMPCVRGSAPWGVAPV